MLPPSIGLKTNAPRQLGMTSTRLNGEPGVTGKDWLAVASNRSTRTPAVRSSLGNKLTVSIAYAPALMAVTCVSVMPVVGTVPAKGWLVSGCNRLVVGTVVRSKRWRYDDDVSRPPSAPA